jgi:23S rRNA pseudouridine2605 synthase
VPVEQERVQKTLARAGFGSRRSAEDLIREGRVTINGREATLGDRIDPLRDQVAVNGVPIPANPELRYFMLNKPAGVTTTMKDAHATHTLVSFLPPGPRVFAVGRLDRETEGLLLLTNDGELAHRIQHPSHGNLRTDAVRRLTTGIDLEDGFARALRVGHIQRIEGRTAVPVVMIEGRKRVVRRMFAAVGHPVRRLIRVRIGPIHLGRLAPGEVRPLGPDELNALYRSTEMRTARPGRSSTQGHR